LEGPKASLQQPQSVAWIDDGFRVATETGAKAVVIAFQANVYEMRQSYPAMPRASGFLDAVQAIARGARRSAGLCSSWFRSDPVADVCAQRSSGRG
jgi:hypothetical protein